MKMLKLGQKSTRLDEDGFLQFGNENGEVVAEFGTTPENRYKYNRLCENWNNGKISLDMLKKEIQRICEG